MVTWIAHLLYAISQKASTCSIGCFLRMKRPLLLRVIDHVACAWKNLINYGNSVIQILNDTDASRMGKPYDSANRAKYIQGGSNRGYYRFVFEIAVRTGVVRVENESGQFPATLAIELIESHASSVLPVIYYPICLKCFSQVDLKICLRFCSHCLRLPRLTPSLSAYCLCDSPSFIRIDLIWLPWPFLRNRL